MELQFVNKDWLMKHYHFNFKQFIKYYINYYGILFLTFIFSLILMFLTFTIGAFLTMIINELINKSLSEFKFILIDFIISFILSIPAFLYVIYSDYKEFNLIFEHELNELQDQLNTKLVDKNDNEKVYLLHDLISNNNITFKDQYNMIGYRSYYINVNKFILDIDDDKYEDFNKINYKDNDVKKILNNKVLKPKLLSKNEALQFYDRYLSNNNQNIKSLEEYNELERRLKDKNRKSENV